jgi:cytochrome c biogenesis protein CcmG, thiol:disulfide interchange protein DsbE
VTRFLLPLVLFVLLAVVLGIGVQHSENKGLIASPLIGKAAPAFNLPDLKDPTQLVRSSTLKGHWYLFNVWGTWCTECRAEHAMLLKVQQAGVVPLVGLDWKDDRGQALAWLSQLGNPYQVVATDMSGREAIEWGVYAAPETFLVNPEGVVVYKQIGALTEEAWKNEILPRVSAPRATGS